MIGAQILGAGCSSGSVFVRVLQKVAPPYLTPLLHAQLMASCCDFTSATWITHRGNAFIHIPDEAVF